MKYYKSSKFTKAVTSTGFITMTACVLIAVGAIAWFSLSKNNAVTEPPTNDEVSQQSYPDSDISYNSNIEAPATSEPTHDANESLSDVPYTEKVESQTDKTESTTNETEETTKNPKFVLPVTGNISKGYSDTALQYSATYGDMRLHTGIDISCKKGTEIKSATDGTVKSVVEDSNLGKVITIDHAYDFTVKYCGFDSVNVKEGDKVTAGQVIGTSGEIPSESSDKPHIHFEVFLNGESISPLEALGLE